MILKNRHVHMGEKNLKSEKNKKQTSTRKSTCYFESSALMGHSGTRTGEAAAAGL